MSKAFMIQKFGGEYDKLFEEIKEFCEEVGVNIFRTDKDPRDEKIIDQIHNEIQERDFCIAEISTESPNVWYEVGYARGVGKKIIQIAKDNTKLPFDNNQVKTIFYGDLNNTDNFKRFKKSLIEKLKYFKDNYKNSEKVFLKEQNTSQFDEYHLKILSIFTRHLDTEINKSYIKNTASKEIKNFNALNFSVAFDELREKGYIDIHSIRMGMGEGDFILTIKGKKYCKDNNIDLV